MKNYKILNENFKSETLKDLAQTIEKNNRAIGIWADVYGTLSNEKKHDKKLTKRETKKMESNCLKNVHIYFTKEYSYYNLFIVELNEKNLRSNYWSYQDEQLSLYMYENEMLFKDKDYEYRGTVEGVLLGINRKIEQLENKNKELKRKIDILKNTDIVEQYNNKVKELYQLEKDLDKMADTLNVYLY